MSGRMSSRNSGGSAISDPFEEREDDIGDEEELWSGRGKMELGGICDVKSIEWLDNGCNNQSSVDSSDNKYEGDWSDLKFEASVGREISGLIDSCWELSNRCESKGCNGGSNVKVSFSAIRARCKISSLANFVKSISKRRV